MNALVSLRRRSPSPRLLLVVAVLCIAIALAGCNSPLNSEPALPDGDEIDRKHETLDAFNATFVQTKTTGNETQRTEGKTAVRPNTGEYYIEIYSSDDPQPTFTVSNGSTRWRYNESKTNITRKAVASKRGWEIRLTRIKHMINRARGNSTETPSTVPAVPLVPEAEETAVNTTLSSDDITVSYLGTETISDREAYVISQQVTPKNETVSNQTLYIDTERYVVLRVELTSTEDGQHSEYTYQRENLTFNPDLPAGLFEFTPPEDTTPTDTTEIERNVYETRTALVEATKLSVPDPELPAGFELAAVERIVNHRTHKMEVSLHYTSDTSDIYVGIWNETTNIDSLDGESITVGNRSGVYQDKAQNRVWWNCNGKTHFVWGDISKEQLVAIAASIDCR